MGNCCCDRVIQIDNKAEDLIQKTVSILKIRSYEFEEIEEKLQNLINISIFDVKSGDIKKWITNDIYDKLKSSFIINKNDINNRFYKFQKMAILNYDNFLNNKKENCNNFLFWLICNAKTESIFDKTKIIEKVILGEYKMVTYQTFKSFLLNYINVNLLRITENFKEEFEINSDITNELFYLTEEVYTMENIIFYVRNLLVQLRKKVIRNSINANCDREIYNINVSNEFITLNQLLKFFNKNSFLLDIIQLRSNFYEVNTHRYPYATTEPQNE